MNSRETGDSQRSLSAGLILSTAEAGTQVPSRVIVAVKTGAPSREVPAVIVVAVHRSVSDDKGAISWKAVKT